MFPYIMLQPKVPNNRECKVIFHDGEAKYFNKQGESSQITPNLGSEEAKRMFAFAKKVLDAFVSRGPHAIMNGLVRIDIMVLQDNTLVVNEIEGIDSNYSCKNMVTQQTTLNFLGDYWYSVVESLFQAFLEKRK